VIFYSINSPVIGDVLLNSTDGRTIGRLQELPRLISLPNHPPRLTLIHHSTPTPPTPTVNSLLGAYGLPQLQAASGYKFYDEFDNDYTFEYPKSYVGRKNSLRSGLYLSDFNTTDKVVVETFPESDIDNIGGSTLVEAAVIKLINPANDNGGDSKLFLPPANRIKTETKTFSSDNVNNNNNSSGTGSKEYTYVAFPSETITRSGYQISRKNLAVVGVKRGTVYVLGASARSDQWNKDKEEVLRHVVESFRLR
jgi:hypothetical protein